MLKDKLQGLVELTTDCLVALCNLEVVFFFLHALCFFFCGNCSSLRLLCCFHEISTHCVETGILFVVCYGANKFSNAFTSIQLMCLRANLYVFIV